MSTPPPVPPTPASALPPRRMLSGRNLAAVVVLAVLVVALFLPEAAFTVIVSALAAWTAWDLADRLDRSHPAPAFPRGAVAATTEPEEPGGATERREEATEVGASGSARGDVSKPLVAAASALVCLTAGWRLRDELSIYLGLAVAVVAIGVWGMARTGQPGLSSVLGRTSLVVFLCGFGAAHAVLMRLQPLGHKVAIFLVVWVAAYEVAGAIFEAAEVRITPGRNRAAPLAGAGLCAIIGAISGTVASPPLGVASGILLGLAAAGGAAVGRALPALFDPARLQGGMQVAAVASTVFVAAPVTYYLSRVVL